MIASRAFGLVGVLDDAQYAALQDAAQQDLSQFQQLDGSVLIDSLAHIVTAVRG